MQCTRITGYELSLVPLILLQNVLNIMELGTMNGNPPLCGIKAFGLDNFCSPQCLMENNNNNNIHPLLQLQRFSAQRSRDIEAGLVPSEEMYCSLDFWDPWVPLATSGTTFLDV